MTSTYILIVAIVLLGGVLATLGDRIGTKVGKARLSLFKLRPRNTATLVTIITGSLIATSTLGILLATSGSLRKGLFELESIQKKLRNARNDVNVLNSQKSQVESELAKTKAQQAEVQKRLQITNRNFQQAQTQLKKVSQQAIVLRDEIKTLLGERQALLQQRSQLSEQITQLKGQISQLKGQITQLGSQVTQLKELVAQRDRELSEQDKVIALREASLQEVEQQLKNAIAQIEQRKQLEEQLKNAIAQRETRLQGLEQELTQREVQLVEKNEVLSEKDKQLEEGEKQLAFLQRQVESLEQYYQNYRALRQGNVALVRGQILAFQVVKVTGTSAATQAVYELLSQANQTAMGITRSSRRSPDDPLVQITQTQLDQLINQIKDGKDYVLRILSAGNYVEGENQIQVFADVALNQMVFEAGDVLAAVSADSSSMTNEQIRQRLDQLLAASQFRARRAGVLGDIQVGDGRLTTIIRFIQQLEQSDQPLDVKAVAQDSTYTAGPLKMRLVATKDGQIIFST
jgi:uncharacterized protein (DUF3084 family)